jgi:DNA-directed RNA polymerase specialized sigma24 family protein
LRLSRADTSGVEDLGEWLTIVVARICLNMLRSRQLRREEPLGVHVPEPIIDRADGTDPDHEALLADSVGLALLVVLEPRRPSALGRRPHDHRSRSARRSSRKRAGRR